MDRQDNQKPGPSRRVQRAKSAMTPSHSTESLKNKIREVNMASFFKMNFFNNSFFRNLLRE